MEMLIGGRWRPASGPGAVEDRGDRGVATYNRAYRFGLDPGALDRADGEVVCVVQVESAAAVAQADATAAVDGVDVLFVGPRDLSHDLGVPGDVTAPGYLESLDAVRAAAARHGKGCGLLAGDGDAARRLRQEGWSFVGIGSDSTLLAAALGTALAAARTDDTRGGDR
jgi:2-dehydro-3-deoxyglucarate aldolase/4-hydroxy-2-oxoheptanedioate aldolase